VREVVLKSVNNFPDFLVDLIIHVGYFFEFLYFLCLTHILVFHQVLHCYF
jgi:hypothetical protein